MLYTFAWGCAFLRKLRDTAIISAEPNGSAVSFSPRNQKPGLAPRVPNLVGRLAYILFPDDCRLCERPLLFLSRIPVCPACMALPRPIESDLGCRVCRVPLTEETDDLCSGCREGETAFDAAYSFGRYEGPLRQLVHLFKYGKVDVLHVPLGRMMAQALPQHIGFDLVIAMPMHWTKRLQRGFNQAELLATEVGRRYGLKPQALLKRTRRTKAQASLAAEERRRNLKGSFALKAAGAVQDKRVLLVDDVMTTGSTLKEAAKVLREGGAQSITALTLARVDDAPAREYSRSLQSLAEALGAPTEQVLHLQ